MSNAYLDGAWAYMNGQLLRDNPFKSTSSWWQEWQNGWFDARNDIAYELGALVRSQD